MLVTNKDLIVPARKNGYAIFRKSIIPFHFFFNSSSFPYGGHWRKKKITSLNQKTKDRLTVIAVLALEAFFIFGSVSNFYRYSVLKIGIDLYLAIFSTILALILLVFIIVLVISYLDKRKVLESFKK